jgi:hypothetical protein
MDLNASIPPGIDSNLILLPLVQVELANPYGFLGASQWGTEQAWMTCIWNYCGYVVGLID